MPIKWDGLAAMAQRDRSTVETEAATAWLESELREIDREIAAYVRQYAVKTPNDLDEMIRSGGIEGHPTWEDRIEWGNLLDYRDRLLGELAKIANKDSKR